MRILLMIFSQIILYLNSTHLKILRFKIAIKFSRIALSSKDQGPLFWAYWSIFLIIWICVSWKSLPRKMKNARFQFAFVVLTQFATYLGQGIQVHKADLTIRIRLKLSWFRSNYKFAWENMQIFLSYILVSHLME